MRPLSKSAALEWLEKGAEDRRKDDYAQKYLVDEKNSPVMWYSKNWGRKKRGSMISKCYLGGCWLINIKWGKMRK